MGIDTIQDAIKDSIRKQKQRLVDMRYRSKPESKLRMAEYDARRYEELKQKKISYYYSWRKSFEGKEKYKRIRTRYYLKNRDKLRQRRMLKWLSLVNLLGGKCCICGFIDVRALQLDHPASDARYEINKHGSYYRMIDYYVNHPEEAKQKLQVLCANHNWIKRHEKQELHQIIDDSHNF